ncbi:MAG: folylpolyglutamate synthase/dihydrofolate synthase family protein [Planctomycetota bacterium]
MIAGKLLSYEAALAYLYGRIDYERAKDGNRGHDFRLQRTRELFERLDLGRYLHQEDHPSPPVPVIHIAGTKGKGSTATMVGDILGTAGYRVGVYTSPHLTDLEERFRINGVPCRPEELIELVEHVRPVVDAMDEEETISFFELTTALSVLHFDRNDCEAIVLEVGLGGRLDSTNVCASHIAAITSIGLDHQRVLGNSRPEIAAEKAGIIKSPSPVVSGVQDPASVAVIRAVAAAANATFHQSGEAFRVEDFEPLSEGSRFRFVTHSESDAESESLDVVLGLDGIHQAENAAVAIAISRLLRDRLDVDDEAIRRGLSRTRCAGRFERFPLGGRRQVIVDTAHNEDSIAALCATIRGCVARESVASPVVVVFGSSRDKDVASMASRLAVLADEVICTQFTEPPRFLDAASAEKAFTVAGARKTSVEPNAKRALDAGRQSIANGGTLVVCGSFFLAGELRPIISDWEASPMAEPACSESDA